MNDAFVLGQAWPLLLPVPVLAVGLTQLVRRRALARSAVFGARASRLISGGGSRPGVILFTLAVLFAVVALLQPRWGEAPEAVAERGVDLVVCLDVSRSMLAQDVAPDRLRAAQAQISALAEQAQSDRLALVVFAGEARLLVPLTQDRPSFVALARTAEPLSVARGGTDLAAALDLAGRALEAGTEDQATVVLVTDGEDNQEQGLRAAERLAQRGVRVHAVGIGTALGGKIPLATDAGPAGSAVSFLRDRDGVEVVTRLDGESLARIAEATGGVYVATSSAAGDAAAGDSATLVGLYQDHVLPRARAAADTERRQERPNRFQWPLAAAFFLFILDLWCIRRRSA